MTSSQQARESLGNLTDLFTGMLGTDVAIGGATPDTTPENKLVDVRGGTPTVTLPPWDTRKTAARQTYKMLSNSAGSTSLAITKQQLTT